MTGRFKVVDLFAGPGGLAEGFSALRDDDGKRVFDISLSVEKEASAFATLRLRSFTRQFGALPDAYYNYIAGRISLARLREIHPEEWNLAVNETMMLELGTPTAQAALDPVLEEIRRVADGAAVLIGGPPCQAYSLVGRARNRGVADYVASDDPRHFLYREYIRIIDRLKPIAFVMENVKGMLSSKVDGEPIIDRILADLRSAGGADGYTLVPLVSGGKGPSGGHVIRCEDFGIPQRRHRVILLGIRSDAMRLTDAGALAGSALEPAAAQPTVSSVLSGMPILRSGLSKAEDSPEGWRKAAVEAFITAARACERDGTWLSKVSLALRKRARDLGSAPLIPPRSSTLATPVADNRLGAWLCDSRLDVLPNNQTRGHMQSDLARYVFAATFAEHFDRSPKAEDYPSALAPAHENWASGKFADRFRVQRWNAPATTVTSHISKDGHYFIHPDPNQCRSLTVREAARLQTFPDNYLFEGNRTQQYVQVGNAVPPLLALQIAKVLNALLAAHSK